MKCDSQQRSADWWAFRKWYCTAWTFTTLESSKWRSFWGEQINVFLDRIDFLLLRGVLFATSCHGFEKRVLHKLIFHETNLQSLTMHVDLCCGSEVRLSLFRRAIQTSMLPFFNEMPEYRSLALIGRQFITYSRNMTTHFITSHCHAALSIRSSNWVIWMNTRHETSLFHALFYFYVY